MYVQKGHFLRNLSGVAARADQPDALPRGDCAQQQVPRAAKLTTRAPERAAAAIVRTHGNHVWATDQQRLGVRKGGIQGDDGAAMQQQVGWRFNAHESCSPSVAH